MEASHIFLKTFIPGEKPMRCAGGRVWYDYYYGDAIPSGLLVLGTF